MSDPSGPSDVEVTGTVRLGQFLKLAGVVGSGGEARELLAEGRVSVNGEVDDRRGRQLSDGDVVGLGGREWRVLVG